MADEPKLVTALEVRLNTFEKQLKEAGLIAEREVKNIEDKFSKANPVFAGSFLGSFLGNIASQIPKALISFVEDLIGRFRDLEKTAKLVNIEMNELFGLQEAAHKLGAPIEEVTTSVRNLATLLAQMQRGEENSLSKLFDANPEALKGVNREALTFQQTLQIVADLVRNANKEIEKIDLAKAAGQAESMIPALEKGGAALDKLQKDAAASAPDLQRLANLAKDFDKAWSEAITNLKAYVVDGFAESFRRAIEDTVNEALKLLNLFKGGVFTGGPLDSTPLVKRVQDLQNAINEGRFGKDFNFETAGAAAGTLQQRRAGDVSGGGTTTRDPNAPISKVPVTSSGGSDRDRLDANIERVEKRTAVITAETAAINLGTAAREEAKVKEELLTVAMQVNGTVSQEQVQRINAVAAAYGKAAAAIEQARAPLETFARESANLGKQLNTFAATALEGTTSALADIVTGSKSAAEAFSALSKSIINDLAKIAIRQTITGPIAQALGGVFQVGGGGLSSAASPGPIFSPFAEGGAVRGPGSSTSDSILASLSNGEFVVNADAARKWGPLLAALNDGKIKKFADGGWVNPGSVDRGGGMGGEPVFNVNVIAPPGSTAKKSEARPNGTGGFDMNVLVEQIEAGIAGNVANGQGALNGVLEGRGVRPRFG